MLSASRNTLPMFYLPDEKESMTRLLHAELGDMKDCTDLERSSEFSFIMLTL